MVERESEIGFLEREKDSCFGHMACDPSSLLVYLEIDARGRKEGKRVERV